MHIGTNHLADEAYIRTLTDDLRVEYTRVPQRLSGAARRLLGDEQAVTVPRSSKNPVAKWAAEKRRNRRKMVRASRKANRK